MNRNSFIRADIAGSTTSYSIDLGDFDGDADTIFLEVFDSANNSLGFVSQLLDANFIGMQTLSLSADVISYGVFGSIAPSANGSSVYADNLVFGAVPEAASTLWLMVAGLGALA